MHGDKDGFPDGKAVDTFLPVRTVELLLAAGALLGACAALAALRRLLSRASRPGGIARTLLASLGDAVLLIDDRGRIVEANDAARRLAGDAGALVEKELSSFGPDLVVLARGLGRGPASGIVSLAFAGKTIRARAALAVVSRRPGRALVAIRPEPAPERPPPLPARRPARPVGPSASSDPRENLAALVAAAREPLARAGHAASLLRLTAPPLGARAASCLAALEEALEDADRRASAFASAGQVGVRHAVDLAALVEDVAGAVPVPAGVRVRSELRPARALADDRALRVALREVLRAAASTLAAGAELTVAVRGGGSAPVIEIAGQGTGAGASAAAFARALLAPHGGRVEEEQTGAGWRLRVSLPVAPAEALAPA